MKLDRNKNSDGRGKYALVKMRELTKLEQRKDYSATNSVEALHLRGILDYGDNPSTDFFVIRLKDRFAPAALWAYAGAVLRVAAEAHDDGLREYADEVFALAKAAESIVPSHKPD